MTIQENSGDSSLLGNLLSGAPIAPKSKGKPVAAPIAKANTPYERYVTRELGTIEDDEVAEANKLWLSVNNPAVWTGV